MNWLWSDEKRLGRCAEKGRSRLVDFLWYSDVEHYVRLRWIVNLSVGVLVCTAVYYMAWKRLNFLEFNFYASLAFQLVFIAGTAYAFAKNPIFRCAIFCVCLGAMGRTGQGLFSLFIIERLSDGPVENIVHNFQLTSSIVICHLEIQSKVTAKRISLAAGPIEALLEKHLGNSVTIGKKIIHSLKALIGSFGGDLKMTSDEDDTMATVIDNAQALADREFLVEGGGVLTEGNLTASSNETTFTNETAAFEGDEMNAFLLETANTTMESANATITAAPQMVALNETQRPIWTRFKSALARAVTHRFVRRCEEMFSGAVKSCHENFENFQSICYEKMPFLLKYFVCGRLNALSLCQPGEMTSMADRYCERGLEMENNATGNGSVPFTADLDAQLESVQNVSREISDQLKLNLHFQAIEEPALEHIRALDEIKAEIQADVDIFRVILDTLKDVLSACFVLLLYSIFSDAVKTINNYLNDLDFSNHFLTNDFWYIDARRRALKKPNFTDEPLNDEEIEHHKLIHPMGAPKIGEVITSWTPVLRWIVLLLVVFIIIMFDYYLYRVIMLVVRFGGQSSSAAGGRTSFVGEHTLQINVQGDGPIAEIIKDILDFKFVKSVREDITNEMCLTRPRSPDWGANIIWLAIPLVVMLLLQLVFSFVINRIMILYILGFVFRRRAKERTKYLYRKLLASRQGIGIRAKKLGLVTWKPTNAETSQSNSLHVVKVL